MEEIDAKSNIENYRRQINDRLIKDAFKWSMIVFIPAAILQLLRIIHTGFQPIMAFLFISIAIVIICIVFQRKLSYRLRAIVFILLFFIMGIWAMFNYGLIGGGAWWLILSTALSTLLFSKKIYIWMIIVAAFVLLMCAIIYSSKILTFRFNISAYAYSPLSWFASILGIVFVLILISKGIERMNSHLIKNQTELIKRNQSLTELTQKLEDEIENRKLTEEELRNEKKFTNKILNTITDTLTIYEPETGKAIMWNKAFEVVAGYSHDEVEKMKAPDSYFDKKELEKGRDAVYNIFHMKNARVELNLCCKNGRRIPFEYSGSFIPDDSGNPKYFIAIGRDISERKKYEKKIIQSEEQFRLIIENTPIVFWVAKLNGNTIYISPNISKVYGYTNKEILEEGRELWFGRIHTDDIEQVENVYRSLIEKGEPFDVQYRIQTKDGRWIWINDIGEKNNSETGEELVYGVFTDITARKNAEVTIKESEEKYRMMFQLAGDAAQILQDDMFVDYNEKALSLLKGTKEELIGLAPWELSPPIQADGMDSKQKANEKIQAVLRGSPQQFEWQHMRLDGTIIDVEVSLNIIDKKKNICISIWRDITERKQLQRRIYNARVEAEENERARYAKELHDGLGPILSSVKFNFEWLSETTDKKKRRKIVEMGNKNIEEAFISLKEISNNLTPHILNNFGLFEATKSFIDKISQKSKTKFSYTTNCNKRFNSEIEIAFYRIVQELVNNTLKYAKAKNIGIEFFQDEDYNLLSLIYLDDGIGFDLQKILDDKKGFGLFNIKNRIILLGGTISIDSANGQGMKLKADIILTSKT
ncbi:MAG: PAS domain S-box protein [Bacteroidales bacterium]|nr:PAS domain S-box protein [Bacteroidales bacterium]